MKFILRVEENGYEFRFWDEINEEIRDSIISSWDKREIYNCMVNMDFNIKKKTLNKAIEIIDSGERDFVVFSSKTKPNHLDTLHDDFFEIEE